MDFILGMLTGSLLAVFIMCLFINGKEMKLNVEDYVRTKKGIAKIIGRVNDPTNYFYRFWICDRYLELNDDTEYIHEQDIIGEPSENPIDLIEEGDYVNGYKVLNILDFNDNSKMLSLEKIYDSKIANEDIKSIVTKEQFESMKYVVKED